MIDLDKEFQLIPKFIGELYQGIAPDTATSVYSPPADRLIFISSIVVANTSNAGRWWSLYIDQDGTTYDNSTVLFKEVALSGEETTIVDVSTRNGGIFMSDSNGNLAVQGQNATDLTITIFGTEYYRL